MKKKKLNESIMKNLKEYVNIENIHPMGSKDDIWLSGDVEINGTGYNFSAKVFMEPSEYGINGGQVSKLCIGNNENCILNYDRGWDILDPMFTPDILEDIVEALETFREKNPYKITNESLKEDFWNPGKYFRALQDMEDIDADKWNSASQEERDKMVTPYLTNFWNKYKEEMTQADLDALFDDMEDSNYHTPARVLTDIINKDRSKGKKKKVVKEGVEDTSIGPVVEYIKKDIENIIQQCFDGTDFFVGLDNIDLDEGKVTLTVTAFGSDENEDGNNAMEREVVLNIPSLNYEAALVREIENWMSEHNSPDSFYEAANPTIKLSDTYKTIDIEKKDDKEDTDTVTLSNTYKTIDVPKGSVTATPSIARTINSKRPNKKISEAEEEYNYNLIDLREKPNTEMKKQFKEFYDDAIFTWEGMSIDDDNLKAIVKELDLKNPTFYIYSGRQMNGVYRLSGHNAYPSSLTFLSIKDYYNPMMKLRVGARWFNDIVDNNRRRN